MRDKAYVCVPELGHDEFEGFGGMLRPALGQCDSTGDCGLLRCRHLTIVSVVDAYGGRIGGPQVGVPEAGPPHGSSK